MTHALPLAGDGLRRGFLLRSRRTAFGDLLSLAREKVARRRHIHLPCGKKSRRRHIR